MSMGRKNIAAQSRLWVESTAVQTGPGHPFYAKLSELLRKHECDEFVEGACARFYARSVGRPSIPPGVYFRLLMIGYFEGIESERGIAWRVADSLSLRQFLGYAVDQATPDHSSMSRIRRRIDLETHKAIFTWVLDMVAKEGLLKAKSLGVDATTLEANAALRSIVRRDSGASYEEFLRSLAAASGIETPTRADLARIDRKRKGKGSNDDWRSPSDGDARIAKRKDGWTHLAHKAEHVIDLETNAVVAVTLQQADRGETETLAESLTAAAENLLGLGTEAEGNLSSNLLAEVVADKGYHSGPTLVHLGMMGYRTQISEPARGRRNWRGKAEERRATYANCRRVRSARGRLLQRKRGELLEPTHAHLYETGAMRRTHLRQHANILKRLLVHTCAFNLSLIMRKMFGFGTPRSLRGPLGTLLGAIRGLFLDLLTHLGLAPAAIRAGQQPPTRVPPFGIRPRLGQWVLSFPHSSTGC